MPKRWRVFMVHRHKIEWFLMGAIGGLTTGMLLLSQLQLFLIYDWNPYSMQQRSPSLQTKPLSFHPHHEDDIDLDVHVDDMDVDDMDDVDMDGVNQPVLILDEASVQSAQATMLATSQTAWEEEEEEKEGGANVSKDAPPESLALAATIDRRPVTWRRRVKEWYQERYAHEDLSWSPQIKEPRTKATLGCCFSTFVMVDQLPHIRPKSFQNLQPKAECVLRFQFSNRRFAQVFAAQIQRQGHVLVHHKSNDGSIVRVHGKGRAILSSNVRFQHKNMRQFPGFPWNLDCAFPNNIPLLTCEELSELSRAGEVSLDDVQSVRLETKFQLVHTSPHDRIFSISSSWPFLALQTHHDAVHEIAQAVAMHALDATSAYVPPDALGLSLALGEGPVFAKETLDGKPSLLSTTLHSQSKGGAHARLASSLIQQARQAPHSTRIIGVAHGQVMATMAHVQRMLSTPLERLSMSCHEALYDLWHTSTNANDNTNANASTSTTSTASNLKSSPLSPLAKNTLRMKRARRAAATRWEEEPMRLRPFQCRRSDRFAAREVNETTATLSDLLQRNGIHIRIVAFPLTSWAFESMPIAGQYAFDVWLTARFAADFHVLMYFDGDALPFIGPSSRALPTQRRRRRRCLQDMFYHHFFSPSNKKLCNAKRFHLIEQSLAAKFSSTDTELSCQSALLGNATRWQSVLEHCDLHLGNLAARCDSILALNVHHTITDKNDLPTGIEDCVAYNGENIERFSPEEAIELHLTPKGRSPICTCLPPGR